MPGRSKEKQRPGVVVYFDMIPTLQKLSAEAKAAVLMAALANKACAAMMATKIR